VLLPLATALDEADRELSALLTPERIKTIVDLIPEEWLTADAPFASPEAHREAYAHFLLTRVAHSPVFVKDAQDVRATLI
jgi:hypothetical protein